MILFCWRRPPSLNLRTKECLNNSQCLPPYSESNPVFYVFSQRFERDDCNTEWGCQKVFGLHIRLYQHIVSIIIVLITEMRHQLRYIKSLNSWYSWVKPTNRPIKMFCKICYDSRLQDARSPVSHFPFWIFRYGSSQKHCSQNKGVTFTFEPWKTWTTKIISTSF